MKKLLSLIAVVLISIGAQAQSKVYFTKEISPESLVKIYKALGVEAKGRVAVKISTGEGGEDKHWRGRQPALPEANADKEPRGRGERNNRGVLYSIRRYTTG